jgi:regulator of PEP synthase PpsR (kinase-PPPase family)
LTALLTQFPPGSVALQFHTFVRTRAGLDEVLDAIKAMPGAVCHAVVAEPLKRRIAAFCRASELPPFDLTGGLTKFLARVIDTAPRNDVAALHRIDEGYKRRIGALEYTLSHDDGLGLATLADAEIVLVGVSRTGKTPTSIYLAQQGYRVANVSLAIEVAPPAELLALPPGRVVGLLIDPQQLALIRGRRAAAWRMERTDPYGDPSHVAREIAWARQLFVARGWPALDVTDHAIEETAARVLEVLGLSQAPGRTPGSEELA